MLHNIFNTGTGLEFNVYVLAREVQILIWLLKRTSSLASGRMFFYAVCFSYRWINKIFLDINREL